MNLAELPWHEPGGAEAARKIGDFLIRAGFDLEVASVEGLAFLPGLAIDRGRLLIDPQVPSYPGDLLHEAGHVAVLDPERRVQAAAVTNDGGDEMAAIAWSVAAARAVGLPLEVLFHPQGYKGDSQNLIESFSEGQPFGVPLLIWWGMTSAADFPAMQRWIR